jgi:hypothetical protein
MPFFLSDSYGRGHSEFSRFTWRLTLKDLEAKLKYVRFEVFTVVTLKKAVFWDVAPFLRNVGLQNIYTTPHPRRRYSSKLKYIQKLSKNWEITFYK